MRGQFFERRCNGTYFLKSLERYRCNWWCFPFQDSFFPILCLLYVTLFTWSSGLSQFSRRKRFWICMSWFRKQLISSKEMIKKIYVPPQTFPVLMYAGMYCKKIELQLEHAHIHTHTRTHECTLCAAGKFYRLSDSEKWKVSVLLCTFWAHSERVVLAMWLNSSLDDLVHLCIFKSGLIHVTA